MWYRNWNAHKMVLDTYLKDLENASEIQKILLPRVVGAENNPEKGCHFILWVFDIPKQDIRVYDNTGVSRTISEPDMQILRNAFRNVGSLNDWTITYPQQWHRDDGRNCGVFVCTVAEMEARNIKMNHEMLHIEQLRHLRLYHATSMVKNIQSEAVEATKSVAKNSCMAQKESVCLFQKINSKKMHPHIKTLNWIQCDQCQNWLHTDCAGISLEMVTDKTPFSCGCDTNHKYPFKKTLKLLKEGLLVNCLLDDEEILKMHQGLTNGTILSIRMYLLSHHAFSLKLRKFYNVMFFSEKQTEAIIERIYEVTKLNRGNLENTTYILEVLTPEIALKMLQKTEGFNRYQAEMAFQSSFGLEL
ncbi:uncharacterized protein [Paramisgurnus dabryanus]|uniref:uncharacterized protein n=1 Tax=Paramisgurnus dabryanus TaxID=90735 RepID=UPI003CCF3556